MTFLVYEIKFTVGKSKEMVFTEGKRRDRWGNWTLWRKFAPKRCIEKNTAAVLPWIAKQR